MVLPGELRHGEVDRFVHSLTDIESASGEAIGLGVKYFRVLSRPELEPRNLSESQCKVLRDLLCEPVGSLTDDVCAGFLANVLLSHHGDVCVLDYRTLTPERGMALAIALHRAVGNTDQALACLRSLLGSDAFWLHAQVPSMISRCTTIFSEAVTKPLCVCPTAMSSIEFCALVRKFMEHTANPDIARQLFQLCGRETALERLSDIRPTEVEDVSVLVGALKGLALAGCETMSADMDIIPLSRISGPVRPVMRLGRGEKVPFPRHWGRRR